MQLLDYSGLFGDGGRSLHPGLITRSQLPPQSPIDRGIAHTKPRFSNCAMLPLWGYQTRIEYLELIGQSPFAARSISSLDLHAPPTDLVFNLLPLVAEKEVQDEVAILMMRC
jgi:hypothetical protein